MQALQKRTKFSSLDCFIVNRRSDKVVRKLLHNAVEVLHVGVDFSMNGLVEPDGVLNAQSDEGIQLLIAVRRGRDEAM